MNDDLIAKLSFGDMRTTGKVDEIVVDVQQNPALVEGPVECLTNSNPGVRMRAADALAKSTAQHPEWLKRYKSSLLAIFENSDQQEVLWHLAQIIPGMCLNPDEKLQLFPILKSKYKTSNSSIVKTFILQTLVDLSFESPTARNEVKTIVEDAVNTGSPAMKSRAKKLIIHFDPF
jgi:hypothetical protein